LLNFLSLAGYLTLASNNLVGTIPSDLRLCKLFYLDLGYNHLNGSIPADWLDDVNKTSLRALEHLRLDHNKMTGSLPTNFATLGDGRVNELYLNDNHFTGHVPGGYVKYTFLQRVELQNNRFASVDQGICNLAVWVAGEMASLKADCKSCDCEYFCQGANGTRHCFGINETRKGWFR
jgi:hypothetical protein